MEQTFDEWCREVNLVMIQRCSLGMDDLPDQTWHDWYDSGLTPDEAVQQTLENEGFPE